MIHDKRDPRKSTELKKLAFQSATTIGNRDIIALVLEDKDLDLPTEELQQALEMAWTTARNMPIMELLMNDRRVIAAFLSTMGNYDEDSVRVHDPHDFFGGRELFFAQFKHRPQWCLSVHAEEICKKHGVSADSR